MSDWIPLLEAAEAVVAALFTSRGITPTARRTEAAKDVKYAHTMIERQWRRGILSLRGKVETRLQDGSISVAINAEMDPKRFEEASFYELGAPWGARPPNEGEHGIAVGGQGFNLNLGWINATDICVNRADLEEWLKYRLDTLIPWPDTKIDKAEAEKAPPSVDRIVKYLAEIADGSQTQPELKRMAEEHFGCPLPDHARWRPAWAQLPESQKRPRGARSFKSGS
ncbi:MAG: hypothetical protein EOS52_19110 [Mesorhizobium sp.]|uniref:hypothetical protein n=1 Tax=Mesorhizobium sp. TaxID=1871066 RepID=UPI000FE82011|nr:hypothetical protein [Mesorhizobium sp.]RWC12353.1 MAG: hypothetical protein EOS52_19110 [Mesorhizobium sp.]